MKHSHIVRVTRLGHPNEFEFAFVFRLGFAESPAEARRWGALKGTPTERPAVDFEYEPSSHPMLITVRQASLFPRVRTVSSG